MITKKPGVPMSKAMSSRQPQRWHRFKRIVAATTGTMAIAFSVIATSASADPFRSSNPKPIGPRTEEAFTAIFRDGNYTEASRLLQSAETSEPLAHAMKASIAYMDRQEGWQEDLRNNAQLTLQTAQQLVATDPLRGHLYTAAGYFLEGAYAVETQGLVAATPLVLGKLQQVFSELEQAERINPNDPELNLVKGYMDLMLAVNLPFSDPAQAIERLEKFAAPSYLAQRGIAIGYRDLRQEERALQAVDRALQETPENPELHYLKAQILVRSERDQESLEFFRRALERRAQLPRQLRRQIAFEECRTVNRIATTGNPNARQRNCNAARNQ
jgi:tetratricopeptide (TPR) repeat protein